MNWFARNVLLLHLLALVAVFSWVHGGTRPDLLLPVVPWLTLMLVEWLLVFPQARSTETLSESRRRVWRALARDPLLYVTLAVTALLVVPLFNVAEAPRLDAGTGLWVIPKPPLTWLPYCVKPDEHAVLLLWFPPVLAAALAAKHGLLKRSRRVLLEAICWNGAALAVVGFAQLLSGTDRVLWLTPLESYFFSTFGYPNFAGAFFTLHAALSLGLWFQHATEEAGLSPFATADADADEEPSLVFTHRMLLPAALSALGAVASLSRAAILLTALVLAALVAYMLAYVWKRVGSATRVSLVSVLGAVVLAAAVSLFVFKLDRFKTEVRTITPAAVWARVAGSEYYHARIAKAIFRDHSVFGVGGWGYPLYQHPYLTPQEAKRMQIQGGANVHNDALQILAEQGAVGFGLLLAAALLLAVPLAAQSVRLCRMPRPASAVLEKNDGWLYRIPPPVVAVWIGTTATVCHSLGDLPFRAPSVLSVWVLALVCVSGWLPSIKTPHRR